MNGVLEGLKSLGTARLLGLVVAAAMTIVALLTLTNMSGSEPMTLLYGELDLSESAAIVEHLDKQQIPYQLRAGGRQIFVTADRVARARLMLAREALPSGGVVGYEIIDRGNGMATTQFEQRMNQLRALEGELTRTIRAIQGVRNARVHIVLPRREPFERQTPVAQASVLVTTGGAGLDRESVQAIAHLVATAVPGLKVDNITIADQRGNLLTRSGNAGTGRAQEHAEELRRAMEVRLARSVEEILERGTGPGRVRAEATVDLDLDRVSETREQYDPEGQVVRSTQTGNSSNRTSEAATSSVSVQNNLPNADAGQAGTGSQEQRQDETTNYEISKTVRSLVRDQAQIRRISIAILVDGVDEKAPGGESVWRARSPAELEQMARLAKTAVGFDAKRGDQLEIVNMRFAVREDPAPPEPARLLGLPIVKDDLMSLARTAIPAFVVLAMLLFILRPMVKRLTTAPAAADGTALALAGGASFEALAAGDPAGQRIGGPGRAVMIPGEGGDANEEEEFSLDNVQGAIKATSVRRLTALVERHPEESLSIVRTWLRQEHN
ncbi:MAG: flagellar basal-body MS-ring/collar protein FliF [Alphaproteobacteria bacterium]|nr:flagellar basal-body MS-ring/collar protein FliF [Alphaproteobacteria bacterium]